MEARYFGICSLKPGDRIEVSRWSRAITYIVLLEFADNNDIIWIGRETPKRQEYPEPITIETEIRRFKIVSTKVDAREDWTEFMLQELK